MRKTAIWILFLTLIFLLTSCTSQSSATTAVMSTGSQDGAALVQKRCTACHNLSRVESMNLSSTEWAVIVDNMIGKGTKLSPDEKTLVIDYLASTYGQ